MPELTMARWCPGASPPAWAKISALAGLPPPDAESILLLMARLGDGDDASFIHLLSREERARMDRFRVEPARRAFVVGRGLVRSVLARATGVDARTLAIGSGPLGKPVLAAGATPDAPRFNLSHSGDRVLVGFTRMGELGVDIEAIRSRRMLDRILERQFHPDERAVIEDERGFYRGWTIKEAVVKALGRGIGYPTASFSAAPLLNGAAEQTIEVEGLHWLCTELDVDHGYTAALAVERSHSTPPGGRRRPSGA